MLRRRLSGMIGAASQSIHRRGRLVVGESRFRELRESGAAFVDKTALIDDMIATDHRFVICRPPSFGKTTMVTLLKELFSGHKHLFDGTIGERLDIANGPWDWVGDVHEVLLIDLKPMAENPSEFRETLLQWMCAKTESLGSHCRRPDSLKSSARDLIEAAADQSPSGRCVVLIDNYDAPIRQGNPLTMKRGDLYLLENAQVLSDWISGLRAEDVRIRFQLFTGAYKVHTQVFDTAVDLSVANSFSTLCGFTGAEIVRTFPDELEGLRKRHAHVAESETEDALAVWYGGYAWGDIADSDRIHNPFAVLNALIEGEFRPFWSQNLVLPGWIREEMLGGLHTAVAEAIDDPRFLLPESFDAAVRFDPRTSVATRLKDSIRLQLLQLGLLTIQQVDYDSISMQRIARLGIPNRDAASVFERLRRLTSPNVSSASPLGAP